VGEGGSGEGVTVGRTVSVAEGCMVAVEKPSAVSVKPAMIVLAASVYIGPGEIIAPGEKYQQAGSSKTRISKTHRQDDRWADFIDFTWLVMETGA
jgi:hypothetical protein